MDLVDKIKKQVAKDFGVTIELPTLWDYAMALTYRTKKQLSLYEEVIRRVVAELSNKPIANELLPHVSNSYVVKDWMDSAIYEFDNYTDAKSKYDKLLAIDCECDIQLYQIIEQYNNVD